MHEPVAVTVFKAKFDILYMKLLLFHIFHRVFSRPAVESQLGAGVLRSAIYSAGTPVRQARFGLFNNYRLLVKLFKPIGQGAILVCYIRVGFSKRK